MKQGLLLTGLIIGVALGLFFAWEIQPVEYYDSYPPLLYIEYRRDWIRMTTQSHGVLPDLTRAQARLRDLDTAEVRQVMDEALAQAVTQGRPVAQLRRMAELAASYGVDTANVRIYTSAQVPTALPATLQPTPLTPATATATPDSVPPAPTPTTISIVLPTPTPQPTPQTLSPYTVVQRESDCALHPTIAISLTQEITVTVRGRERVQQVPLPGVELWLLWDEGADHAFTGLRPERGLGYADFAVEPAHNYTLYVNAPTGAPVATLTIGPCPGDADLVWTTWSLTLLYVEPEAP